jgi:hypothetical protein
MPTFHEENRASHVSFVATVTLGGKSLIPLILTTRNFIFKSEDLTVLLRTFRTYLTPRGYITMAGMIFCLKTMVTPYVVLLRVTRQDPGP